MIVDEKDSEVQQILAGLLILHESLEYKNYLYKQSLEEKDALIKEVHHRVKNNLQIIKSLFALQSTYIKDKEIRAILLTSQFRIDSIAMVHELLYKSEKLTKINLSNYITNLSEKLISSIKGENNNIRLLINIPDLSLNIDTVVPLGLILNEIVSNSLIHGFKNNETGEINIQLDKKENKDYILKINDNGVDFPELKNEMEFETLGLKLIFKLPKQLQGFAEFDKSAKGSGYIINFKEASNQYPQLWSRME